MTWERKENKKFINIDKVSATQSTFREMSITQLSSVNNTLFSNNSINYAKTITIKFILKL